MAGARLWTEKFIVVTLAPQIESRIPPTFQGSSLEPMGGYRPKQFGELLMPVLLEFISVVVRREAIDRLTPGGLREFIRHHANGPTTCADDELVRVGFMSPEDAKAFCDELTGVGMRFLEDGKACDMVVIDRLIGPTTPCDWIEFSTKGSTGDRRKVCSGWLKGSKWTMLSVPLGHLQDFTGARFHPAPQTLPGASPTPDNAPMATSNCSTSGRANCSGQDGEIMRFLLG
jgi:hypothetical protein